MWVWDTLMRHVRGLRHNQLLAYAIGIQWHPKSTKGVEEMKVFGWVCKGCVSGLFQTSSHGLHTSAAIYVGKTGFQGGHHGRGFWEQTPQAPTHKPNTALGPRTKRSMHGICVFRGSRRLGGSPSGGITTIAAPGGWLWPLQ